MMEGIIIRSATLEDAGRFHTRAAFLYSAELSIYIDKEWLDRY